MIILIIWAWVFSWITIPKQYNPDIVVPAFQITIPAPWFSDEEVKQLIINPLENKIMEIEWVEHVYGYTNRDFGSVMVSFFVWVDKEKATTRLYNKIYSNLNLKAIWVQEPIIQAIDPDEIPIYSFAIISEQTWEYINLRKIWADVLDQLKTVKNISSLYLIGWEKENINIKLDLQKLEAKWIDLIQIYNLLQQNNISFPGGDFKMWEHLGQINIEWSLNSIEKVQKLLVWNSNETPIYLEDVANIYLWSSNTKYKTIRSNLSWDYEAVHIWIAKKKWTNAVFVVDNIKKELDKISEKLPVWYSVKEVQNEWKVAEITTNMLIVNLFQSVFIIVIVLSIFMWTNNALNTAVSIPLTLSIIFLYALIIWDNINRITLFALILVLWMLVDDATVVVENINRHIEMREKTWKSTIEAIFDSIKEVELGVVLSTITRLLAFFAMFFVTGMMWEYMWPIPRYAIVAMVTSTVVALSINPFLSYFFANRPNLQKKSKQKVLENVKNTITSKLEKLKLKDRYFDFLNKYLWPENKKRRKKFKMFFRIIIWLVVILPPYFYVFKGRMLPKSDQNQIYIRIDTPASMNISWTEAVAKDISLFMKDYFWLEWNTVNQAKIIKDINYWVWIAPVLDFSNLFRGSANRVWENYISMRLNLVEPSNREITSEEFVLKFRPVFKNYILNKYPNLKVRLLEDPPWPPVRATFMLEIAWNSVTKYEELIELESWLQKKLYKILQEEEVTDIENSIEQYKTNYVISLKHEIISRMWLTSQQIAMTVYSIFQWSEISLYHTENTKEPVNIFLSVKDEQKYNLDSFDTITFTNPQWIKIPLKEVAEIIPTRADTIKYSDDRLETVYLYGEMWNNSVIYPVIKIFRSFSDKEFREWKYELVEKSFYWFKIKNILTEKEYYIKIGWERELTMDTFRDMWVAMIIAFLAIYFMMVAQFKSFKSGGAIMVSFLLWFFWVFPWYAILYILKNEYFSATSMIWVIALAGIVVWNAIILFEYISILVKRWITLKMAVINASRTRMKPILVTSLTTILWATTILWDPVWSGVARSIIWWLTASALLTVTILPIFIYDSMEWEVEEIEKL